MPHTRKLDVLLVEDNLGDSVLIEELLAEDDRASVRHVSRLADVLAEMRRGPANTILLDLDLPDSTGLATIRACHDAWPTTPIVVLTGTTDPEVARQAIRAGATDYLSKANLTTEVLARTLRFALERAESREALAAHKRYLDAVGQSVIVIDVQGIVRYWNEGARRLYGWDASETVGRPIQELRLTVLTDSERGLMIERIMRGETWEGEVVGRKKSGETFPAFAVSAPTKDAEGRVHGIIGVSHDISQIKRLADEAKASEVRAKTAQRIAGLFSYHVDLEHGIVTWDEEAHRQMRFGADVFVPTPGAVMERIDPADREEVERWVKALCETAKPKDVEYHIRRGDGELRLVHVLAEPSIVAGRVVGFTAVGRDVTEQRAREREAELARARETERERLAGLGTLVAGVAHEINNPLSYMQVNAELAELNVKSLLSDDVGPQERKELLHQMESQLAALLKGMQAIAAITKGLKQVAKAPNGVRRQEEMAQLVENVIAVAATRVPANVEIHAGIPPGTTAHVNAGEISQVLLNLLINAGEAIGTAQGRIDVSLRRDADVVHIDVADDGPGIPRAALPNLFTPFFTTKAEGTGLGLSMSRRIVEDHGGRLDHLPGPRRGATFRVTLPCDPPGAPHAVAGPRRAAPR